MRNLGYPYMFVYVYVTMLDAWLNINTHQYIPNAGTKVWSDSFHLTYIHTYIHTYISNPGTKVWPHSFHFHAQY